jgi:hypothetical protein
MPTITGGHSSFGYVRGFWLPIGHSNSQVSGRSRAINALTRIDFALRFESLTSHKNPLLAEWVFTFNSDQMALRSVFDS